MIGNRTAMNILPVGPLKIHTECINGLPPASRQYCCKFPMRSHFHLAALVTLFVSATYADNYQVNVGSTGLAFNPTTVQADAGDTVEFIFHGVAIMNAERLNL